MESILNDPNYLPDTSVCSHYLKREANPKVVQIVEEALQANKLRISAITMAELRTWVLILEDQGAKRKAGDASRFLLSAEVLPFSAAETLGALNWMARKNKPSIILPNADACILATAMDNEMTLLTGDQKFFDLIQKLMPGAPIELQLPIKSKK